MSFLPTSLRLERLEALVFGIGASSYQYVTVTFPATPNTDFDILHSLTPSNPETIIYEVVGKDRSCDIYNDRSGTRRAWRTGYITLRCNTASATVELRLSVKRA